MNVLWRVDINIVAMLFLGLVFFIARWHLDKDDSLNRFFLKVSLIIILQLFLETATCIINRRPELWLIPVTVFFHILLFLIAPVLTYLFYVVVKDMISFEKYEMKKTELPVLIPLAANTVLTILSPFYKTIFFIDSQNVYHRGPLFFVSAAITYFYLVYGLVLLIRNRSKFMRQEFIPLVVFTVLPILGGLVQSVFYGTLFMWSSTAFSLVVIYLYLQQRIVQLDDLTGVWSRNSFENYIARSLRQKESLRMGLIYVDLDDLKQINDLYGHAEGDFAIRASVELIRGVIRKSDTIARMGGDEFVVMLDSLSNDCLGNTMRRIEAAFEEYNKTSGKPYRIGCSFGADVFNSSKISIEQFLHHIDSLMYKNKRLKKVGV